MHFGFHICRWALLTFNDIITECMPMLQAPARRDNVVGSHAIDTRLQEQRIRDSVCQLCVLPIASSLSLFLFRSPSLSVAFYLWAEDASMLYAIGAAVAPRVQSCQTAGNN